MTEYNTMPPIYYCKNVPQLFTRLATDQNSNKQIMTHTEIIDPALIAFAQMVLRAAPTIKGINHDYQI